MEIKTAIKAFAALAHDLRLNIFRALVKAGPEGLSAGVIAARFSVPPSSLSFHLGQLEQAGILTARREQRHIYYAVDFGGARRLLGFLIEDCCQGAPAQCAALLDQILPSCCSSQE